MTRRPHRMRVPHAVPAVLLRVLLVLVGSAFVIALNPYPFWRWLAVAILVVGAVLPRTLAAWAAIAFIALGVLLAPPSLERTAWAVLGVHLIHVLAALSLVIPASGRLSLAACLPTLRRFVFVQALAQPSALLVGLVAAGPSASLAWLAPVGAILLVAAGVLVLRRSPS